MSIRTIVTEGDPVLNKHCHPVTQFDEKLADLLDDMKETLADANGLGLAAPQVGILRRAAIVLNENNEMLELINPEILEFGGEQDGLEGCLSVPGKWGYVKRPEWVRIKAQNRKGEWIEMKSTELTARCICHEMDHLNGHLYTERTDKIYTNEEMDEILAEQEENG